MTDAIAAHFGLLIKQQVYLKSVNFASFEIPKRADGNAILQRLRTEGAGLVEHAVFAPRSRMQYVPNDPDMQAGPTGPQWSHWLVCCPEAWEVTLGDPSVMVAVVDTGVMREHEELGAQVIDPKIDFPTSHCDVMNNDNTVEDQVGHGTFIAGMICAEADNGRTIAGVAPRCRVMPIKVANEPWTTADNLIAGSYLADQLGARVINFSWGSYDDFPLENAMVNDVVADGVLFVCAAGNDDTSDFEYPSSYDSALSVGATDINDTRANFSNWGSYVDICAPGQGLKSCAIPITDWYETDGNGTSYAAPMVAAAAGLIWSYNPDIELSDLRNALVTHGPIIPGFSGEVHRLDIADALGVFVDPVVPTVDGVTLQPRTTYGQLADSTKIDISLVGAQDVKRVRYTLDILPPGPSPTDLTTVVYGGGASAAQFDVTGQFNQSATMHIEYFSASGDKGELTVAPIWIFNQRGDIDGDGVIGPLDAAMFPLLIGMDSNDPNYLPFADSNGDGKVSEGDLASVGYGYGQGIVLPKINSIDNAYLWLGIDKTINSYVVGSGNITYNWNFGGGATPNTSTLPSPTITPGAAGHYNASLTITSEYGTDYKAFPLDIVEKPPIEIILDIKPRVGLAPLNSYFNAHDTKSTDPIVKYEWDWDGDDSTWEQESDFYAIAHTFPDLGLYTIHLRVTDSLGVTAETSAKIRVVEGIAYGSFGSRNLGAAFYSSDGGGYVATGEVGGRTAICWMDPQPESYNVAVAKVDTPLLSSDWRIDKVYTGAWPYKYQPTVGICEIDGEAAFLIAGDDTLKYGRYHGDTFTLQDIPGTPKFGTLANIGGKPAVLAGTNSAPHYIYSKVADPDSPDDWVDVPITAPDTGVDSGNNQSWQLMEYAGVPVYQGGMSDDRRLVWATSTTPTSESWNSFTFPGVHTGAGQFGMMFNEGLSLGLLFEQMPVDEKEILYARLAQFPPTQMSDWTIHQARIPEKPISAMGSVDGLPSFLTRDGELYLSLDPQPADVTDWLLVTTPSGFEGQHIVSHGGLPAMLKLEGGSLKYLYPLL